MGRARRMGGVQEPKHTVVFLAASDTREADRRAGRASSLLPGGSRQARYRRAAGGGRQQSAGSRHSGRSHTLDGRPQRASYGDLPARDSRLCICSPDHHLRRWCQGPARNPEHDRNGRPVGLAHNNRNGRQPRPIWASASSVCASASSAAVARAACGEPIRAVISTPAVISTAWPARCSQGSAAALGAAAPGRRRVPATARSGPAPPPPDTHPSGLTHMTPQTGGRWLR